MGRPACSLTGRPGVPGTEGTPDLAAQGETRHVLVLAAAGAGVEPANSPG